MYKLLIVEDEEKIRNGLATRVAWDELGFRVCGLAANGIEALQIMEKERPHVVMTDVRMPEMDGLKLAEVINKQYPSTNVLILSGFADFEYARQAIKLKIYDYLLKPTDKKILINTFRCLKLRKDQEEFLNKKQREKQFHINAGLEKYKEYFLSKLLHGEYPFIYTIQEQLHSLELSLDGNCFCVCTLHIDLPDRILEDEWHNNRDLLKFSYANIVGELLDLTGCGAVHVTGIDSMSIIFSYVNETELKKHMPPLIQNAMNCINKLIFGGMAKLFAGVGKTYNNILNVHTSFLESGKALDKRFFETGTTIFTYDEDMHLDNENRLVKGYREDSNKIVSATLSGQTDELVPMLKALNASLASKKNVQDIRNYYYVLCFLLKSSLAEFDIGDQIIQDLDFEDVIFSANHIHELSSYVEKIFVDASRRIAESQDKDNSFKQKVIGEVKRYIEQHYKENLSLKMIGQHVHLSPSYISFLFKEVTGETYTEYLKYIRIQNAKALLKHVNLKIYEIAERVGYNDYKYFTLQFKKITGMSPTEYRDNLS
jgi:two-component system response regulator YesN